MRSVQAVDGALSRPAAGDRAAVALDWVRANRGALGLTAADVDGLDLTARATSRGTGFTHLRYRLSDRGIPAFDGGLRVSLDRGGRILSAIGSPAPEADSAAPRLGAVEALRALQRDVGWSGRSASSRGPAGVRRMTHFEGGDFARLVLFGSGRGTRLAWHLTYRATDAEHYDAVVDADSGAVLFRQNLSRTRRPPRSSPATPPRAPRSRSTSNAWLARTTGATVLDGPFARAYSDVDDNNTLSPDEEIQSTGGSFVFPFQAFGGSDCTPTALCSWDPTHPPTRGRTTASRTASRPSIWSTASTTTWRTTRTSPSTDSRTPTPCSSRPTTARRRTRAVRTTITSTTRACRRCPTASPPRMQLYLFVGDGFRTVNGGDSAAIVWHEYTHGLSNRLVTHDDGTGALSSPQAGAMGEGWSDWYALDLLVGDGLMDDTPAPGDVDVGALRATSTRTRCARRASTAPSASSDCRAARPAATRTATSPRSPAAPRCTPTARSGPRRCGTCARRSARDVAQSLITEGMRMAPPEPSFLDMRNAILAADAGLGGARRNAIWQVFAERGMGYRAYSDGADDVAPDRGLQPAAGRRPRRRHRHGDLGRERPVARQRVGRPGEPHGRRRRSRTGSRP